MRNTLVFSLLFLCIVSFSQKDTEVKEQVVTLEESEWTFYNNYEGIKVEYRIEACTQKNNDNQVWLVFKITNTSQSSKVFSWTPLWKRDNVCVNCDYSTDDEFKNELTLEPNEVRQGEACVIKDRRTYIFSHFIIKYPGMDSKKLTSFEFVNVQVKDV